jgi:hypothetical protein
MATKNQNGVKWLFFIKSAIGMTPVRQIINYFWMKFIEYDPKNSLSNLNIIGKIQDGLKIQNGAKNRKNLSCQIANFQRISKNFSFFC